MTLPHDDEAYYPDTGLVKKLLLTRNEALYLDDSLTMMLDTSEGVQPFITMRPVMASMCIPAPVDLIEKIAVAVLFTLDPENEGQSATVELNESDLFCLREVTQSYARVGDELVGFNLKRKIYGVLYGTEYTIGRQLEDVLDGFIPIIKDSESPVTPSQDDEF